jgi:HAMP domain-containing protein
MMGLRTKFNLALIVVFAVGLALTGFVSYQMLQRNARDEVVQHAGIMMEAALAVRSYTVKQVTPHLAMQLQRVFLPQSVAAFAAIETFNALRNKYPEYNYREAALNPTNPRDRAVDWEADIVHDFRNNRGKTEVIGERDTPNGKMMYLARPIQIKDKACLGCHSTPEEAPTTMVKLYGPTNGFGWKQDEIIGAQIVSVPMSLPIAKADRAFYTFMGSLVGIFLALFIILNLMLHFVVIRPLSHMARAADAISTGNLTLLDLPATGKDQVATLARAFNRMRRSLEKAMKMMEE